MIELFHWSYPLGRWAGTQVRIHLLLAAFLALNLVGAFFSEGMPVSQTVAWMVLLLLALAVHELGHIAAAGWLGTEPEDVRLWPLGNFVAPAVAPPVRAPETIPVAFAGLATSLVIALTTATGLYIAGARMILNPFGNAAHTGAPLLASGKVAGAFTPIWWLGWFGYLNWVLFLANLIPALPMDMGRIVRGWTDGPARDNLIAPWTSRVVAIVGIFVAFARLGSGTYGALVLFALAVIVWIVAQQEFRLLDEGGYFDDSVFGYDFSQGYTSLEAGAATVRPRREGALRRWRRRRSDLRRRRREAKEAAEELRMDEILAKLHREGRAALSDDEQRFLVRVSAKYKNRPRAQG